MTSTDSRFCSTADYASQSQADLKDRDPTPRPGSDQWNFAPSGLTPSLMDPNSHAFNLFANQLPGYYTPTPGGTNTLYHSQAGDLHTPGLGLGLGTPLSMPTSDGSLHADQHAAYHGIPQHLPHHFHQQQQQQQQQHHMFQNLDPFQMHSHDQPQSFAPHHFSNQPYDHVDGPIDGSPIGDVSADMDLSQSQNASPDMMTMMHPRSFSKLSMPRSSHPTADKYVVDSIALSLPHLNLTDHSRRFRWHVTLNAPTAMIKRSDEIPITYLNKGQAYTLNVVDTHIRQSAAPLRYRTFVRVSFEDEQQRQRPASCWQLWKEGRGTSEAHQRGGRLQAVEYVESSSTGAADDHTRPRMELESASFDGFCVLWTPTNGSTECPISVRFNFLSTDFSHSKGVKGIPVRLCAKTQIVGDADPSTPEVCYGKVKLFRDHGAERKLSNDVAHVKKSIDKLNQQIAQIESGLRDVGKRKRSGSNSKPGLDHGRPGKVPKHRRTWSMTSATSNNNGGTRAGSAEEDLHVKLMTLQDMFTSTRPASVLYLHGADEDDPDLFPVKMSGATGAMEDIKRVDPIDTVSWDRQSTQTGVSSSLVSPSPSSQSLSGSRRDSTLQQPTPLGGASRVNSNEWRTYPQTALGDAAPANIQQLASPPDNQPVKVQTRSPTTGTVSGWVEAMGVDHGYQAPPDRPIKPVACFYVQPRVAGRPPPDSFHRAVYLMNRSLKDFVTAVALKCDVEPSRVRRTVRISRQGLHVLFDDDCVRELVEGQDLTAEFAELAADTTAKPSREWDVSGGVHVDGELPTVEDMSSGGYELKLLF